MVYSISCQYRIQFFLIEEAALLAESLHLLLLEEERLILPDFKTHFASLTHGD